MKTHNVSMKKGILLILLLVPLLATSSYALDWWNSSWTNRRPLTLTHGTTSIGADWQVFVNVTNATNMLTDCQDCRIVDNDNATLLAIWRESGRSVNGSYHYLWANLASAGNQTLWLYYNYSSATDVNSMSNTFLYSNFEYGVFDKTGWVNTSGGVDGLDNGDNYRFNFTSQANSIIGYQAEQWSNNVSLTQYLRPFPLGSDSSKSIILGFNTSTVKKARFSFDSDGSTNFTQTQESASELQTMADATFNTFQTWEIQRLSNTSVVFDRDDGSLTHTHSTQVPTGNFNWEFYLNDGLGMVDIKYGYVRNISGDGVEPVISIGAEEEALNEVPQWSGLSVNDSTPNLFDDILFSSNWTDEYNLSGFITEHNNSGSMSNESFVVMTGISNSSTQDISVDDSWIAGNQVALRFWVNDSDNEFNVTDWIYSTVDNNISRCITISESGVFELEQNLDSGINDTCLVLGIDNIVLNCADYNITFGGANKWGIVSYSDNDNLTVQNCNVYQNATDNSTCIGIQLDSANNITVQNNYVNTYSYGAWFYQANNLTLLGNEIISEAGVALTTQELGDLTVYDNELTSNTTHGFRPSNITNYNISNNIITSLGGGARAFYATEIRNGNLTYNNLTSEDYSIYFLQFNANETCNNNYVAYNNINSTNDNAIGLRSFGAYAGIYDNNVITGNVIVDNGFNQLLVLSYWNNTNIKDQTILDYDFSDSLLSFENTTFGLVNFTEPITASGSDLSADLVFGNNSVNSSLDFSANVTLYGIGDRGFTIPVILKDGVYCSDCVNYTSLTATNVMFSVTGFSEYEIGDNYTTIEMTIYSPTNTTYQGSGVTASVNVQISVNETLDTAWYEYDSNGTNVSYTPNSSVIVDVGQHNITLWVNNSYGSEDTITIYFTYEQVVAAPTGLFGFNVTEATESVVNVVLILVPLIILFVIVGIYRGWFKQVGGVFRR